MLTRMLWQSWHFGVKRKLLSVITIFFASMLISALLAVSIDVGDKMARELKSYGANILIEPASSALLDGNNQNLAIQDFIDEKELPNVKDIFWRNNIVGFAPLLHAQVQGKLENLLQKSGRNTWEDVNILGTFFDHRIDVPDEENYHTGMRIVSPYWQVEGKWVDDFAPHPQWGEAIPALIGKKLAVDKKWAVGDRLLLQSQNGEELQQIHIKLVGVLSTGGEEEMSIVLPLDASQTLLGLAGKIQSIKVSALTVPENELSTRARKNADALDAAEYDRWYCTAYVSSIALQLEEAISASVVKPIWQVAASEGVIVKKIQLLLIVVTLAGLMSAVMGIASLMTTNIIERSREIGLMKALGAETWQIVLLFYVEAIMSALIGGGLGCIAGYGLAKFIGLTLFGVPLNFAWVVVPCVLVLAIIIALLGTYFPAHRIARLYPVEVLYGRQ